MYKLHHWTPSGRNTKDSINDALKMLTECYLVDRDVLDDTTKIKWLECISDLAYMLTTIQQGER